MPQVSDSYAQGEPRPLSGRLNLWQRLRRWVRPVRSRLTLTATALVTVALLIAGAVLVLVLHQVLLRNADDANTARATEVTAALTEAGTRGPAALDAALFTAGQNIDLVQIIDQGDHVVRSSRTRPEGALGGSVAAGQRVIVDGATASPSDAEYRATRLGIRTDAGTFTVEVGTAESALNRLVFLVAALCAAVFPLIMVAVAWLTYVFVGRALAPVEHIRQQVDAISDADLDERVPVPATGDEVETLARTMNAMLARLESAQHAQRRFIADASHELNSPLTSIFGLLDLADQTAEPVDVETVRTLLLPEAGRMRSLISDLAVLARADEHDAPVRRTEVDLSALVDAEAQRLRALTGHTVTVNTVPAVVSGDPAQLVRALRNLTDNAARYARTALDLSMTVGEGTVTVAVSDDGHGIAPSDRASVFGRFVRLDTARARSSGGAGLGLAIVADIVTAHGGSYGVDTGLSAGAGSGARFWFTVPTQ